jgi:protein-disulfide isomerase
MSKEDTPMRRRLFTIVAALALTAAAGGLLPATAVAQETPPGPSTPAPPVPTDAFGQRVRAYLLTHPEVIMEAVQILKSREQAAQAEAVKAAIAAHAEEILEDPASPVGGNPSGDVTLVEFFDYNCHYCRGVDPTIIELRRADPGLRMVFKEFPILGASSELAARAALAARRQDKYVPLHDALMRAEQPLTEERILAVAGGVGIDVSRLKRDMADPAIAQAIARNRDLAAALGINGTPGFVIGDQLVPGVVDRTTLEGLIAKARKGRSAG